MGTEQAEFLDPGGVRALGSRKPLTNRLSIFLGVADSVDSLGPNSELHSRYTAKYI